MKIAKCYRLNKYYKEKKYEKALESYDKAKETDPKDVRSSYNKGAALYKLEDWEKARKEFEGSSMSKNSELAAKSFYNLGNSQFRNGKYEDAVRSFQQSLRLNPNDRDARYNLQLALRYKKNPPPKQKKKDNDKNKKGKKKKMEKAKKDDEESDKEKNAKRILKSAADDNKNKPIFNPDTDGKKGKKNYVEDW